LHYQEGQNILKKIILKIKHQEIYYLKFILEGYDNLFVISTKDRTTGLVEIEYVSLAKDDLITILNDIKAQIALEENHSLQIFLNE